MLKQDISPMKLATVEELDLIVSLCALIVPSVPPTDFVSLFFFLCLLSALKYIARVLSCSCADCLSY